MIMMMTQWNFKIRFLMLSKWSLCSQKPQRRVIFKISITGRLIFMQADLCLFWDFWFEPCWWWWKNQLCVEFDSSHYWFFTISRFSIIGDFKKESLAKILRFQNIGDFKQELLGKKCRILTILVFNHHHDELLFLLFTIIILNQFFFCLIPFC